MTLHDLAQGLARLMVRRSHKTPQTETFGQRLARLRKARGFTQTELGQMVGLSQRLMTYYEREGGRPPGHLLPRLAEVLSVTVNALLGIEAIPEPAPRHTRLWRKLRDVEKLSDADRKAVLRFIDALLDRKRLQQQQHG